MIYSINKFKFLLNGFVLKHARPRNYQSIHLDGKRIEILVNAAETEPIFLSEFDRLGQGSNAYILGKSLRRRKWLIERRYAIKNNRVLIHDEEGTRIPRKTTILLVTTNCSAIRIHVLSYVSIGTAWTIQA